MVLNVKTGTLVILLITLVQNSQAKGDDGGCMMPVDHTENIFSQGDVRAPPLQSITVNEINECTAKCCQTDRCNVVVHHGKFNEKNIPGNDTSNCVLYACHPTTTCSFHKEDGVHIYINKKDYVDSDDAGNNDGDRSTTNSASTATTPVVKTTTPLAKSEGDSGKNKVNNTKLSTSTPKPPTLPPPPLTAELAPSTIAQNTDTAGQNNANAPTFPSETTAFTNKTPEMLSTFSPTHSVTTTENDVTKTTPPSKHTTPFSQINPTRLTTINTTLSVGPVTNDVTTRPATMSHSVTQEANLTFNSAPPPSEKVPKDEDVGNTTTTPTVSTMTTPTKLSSTTIPNKQDTTQTAVIHNGNLSTTQPSKLSSSNYTSVNDTSIINNTFASFTTDAPPSSNSSLINATEESPVSDERAETINILLICSVSFGCVFLLATVGVLGKRIYEGYRKRHYSRLDYLINGMYN